MKYEMKNKILSLIDSQEKDLTDNLITIKQLSNEIEKVKLSKKDQFKNLMLEIIEIIDTFERIESALNEKQLLSDETSFKVANRFKTVLKRMNRLLERNGVTKLTFPENKLILGYCKVIDTEPDAQKPNDTIIEVQKEGYIHGKELIRESEIVIVKN